MSEGPDLNYVVYASIPYEGEQEVFYGSLEELTAFIKNDERRYSLDDLSIYITTGAPGVYELYNS